MLRIIDLNGKIKAFYAANKAIIIILFISFIVRLSWFIMVQNWDYQTIESKGLLRCDPGDYYNLASSMIKTHSFSDFGTRRTPGYPFFLTIMFFIFGQKIWIVSIVQIIINLCTILLFYYTLKKLFSFRVAVLATGLFAFDFLVIYCSNEIMTETIFLFTLLASISLLIHGLKNINISLTGL